MLKCLLVGWDLCKHVGQDQVFLAGSSRMETMQLCGVLKCLKLAHALFHLCLLDLSLKGKRILILWQWNLLSKCALCLDLLISTQTFAYQEVAQNAYNLFLYFIFSYELLQGTDFLWTEVQDLTCLRAGWRGRARERAQPGTWFILRIFLVRGEKL